MTYFIFNNLNNEQIGVEAQSVASDLEILFKGTKEEFENLGFNENQIGGFELVNGVLTFNQTLYDNSQKFKLPLAQGKDLVSYIEKAFTGHSFPDRMQLQALFTPIKLTLESETCNPLHIEDFNAVLEITNANNDLSTQQKALFINLANTWKEGVRFN